MNTGDLVVVLAKLNSKIKEEPEGLKIGTFWTSVADNKVLVLLPDGVIFEGHERDIVLASEQL